MTLLHVAYRALLTQGCGFTHKGEPVFCDDPRLPDSCRVFACQCRRDAAVVVRAIEGVDRAE